METPSLLLSIAHKLRCVASRVKARGYDPRMASTTTARTNELREELAATCRRLGAEGLVPGTSGNLSVRAGEHVLVSPTGAVLSELEAADVPLVSLAGDVVDGRLRPTSELDLHLGAYRRFDAGAVVHTHAEMATAVSLVVDELPSVHYLMVDLGGTVPVTPYERFGSRELADATHGAFARGHTAAIMANHGTLTYGADLDSAAERTRLLEWVCRLYWHAAAIGTPRALDAAQLQAVRDELDRSGYGTTHAVPAGAGSAD